MTPGHLHNTFCGLAKWCYNAARWVQLLRQEGSHRAGVLVLTDNASFVAAECASASPTIRGIDTRLAHAIGNFSIHYARHGPRVPAASCPSCHCNVPGCLDARFQRAALSKWQFVNLVSWDVLLVTDLDVDLFHYPLQPTRLAAANATISSALQGFWDSGRQLRASFDASSPVNAGCLLLRTNRSTFALGLDTLETLRFNTSTGFNLSGAPHAVLSTADQRRYGPTVMVRDNKWNFVGGNADQGLFAYVYIARLRQKIAPGAKCGWSARHFHAADKPWLLHFTRCIAYFDFVSTNRTASWPTSPCVRWLEVRYAQARLMPKPTWPECGGKSQCIIWV